MFRPLRRIRQQLTDAETLAILDRCTNGILACLGDDDYPYAVPLSFVHVSGRIYFHAATAGHKIDAIRRHAKVSFAVVDQDQIVSEKFTTYFASAIAFGKARIAEGEERQQALRALVEKYSADQPEEAKLKELSGSDRAVIVAIDIEHLTGKQAIEMVKG